MWLTVDPDSDSRHSYDQIETSLPALLYAFHGYVKPALLYAFDAFSVRYLFNMIN